MRILIQNSVFYPNVIGGAEHSSWMLSLRLSARGHQVDAVATTGVRRGPANTLASRSLDGLSGRVHEAPSHGAIDILVDGQAPASLPRKALHHAQNVHSRRWRKLLDGLIAELRPEIVHTNTIVGMTGAVWQAAAAAGVPIVHTLRDYHLLCPRTTLLRSSGVECVDAPFPCRVYRGLKGRATDQVAVVTAPSNFVLQRHLDHGQFPEARAEVVPNAGPPPVDPAPVRPGRDTLHVVYLGQLDDHKGVGLLLDAVGPWFEDTTRPGLRVTFAGAGPKESTVRSFCGRWTGRAHFAGFVTDATKDGLLRDADVLVVPSIWNDNFPRVILDAFRYALPVVGSRRGGIPEVVEHESNGLIVEPEVDSLRAALERLASDGDLRLRLGAQAHRDADRYRLENQVTRFEEIYQSLVGSGVS